MPDPQIDVIVVAFGDEAHLESCLDSVLASVGVDVHVVVVDNGCTRPDLEALASRDRIALVSPGRNLGFAEGCNIGARASSRELIALVNSDVAVAPEALRELSQGLVGGVGLTTACVLQADSPELVNSAGNPMHFLGVSWAGGHGEHRSAHAVARDVVSASGAACMITRALWDELGGFEPRLFLYCEDLDLSLRVWQQGLRVRYLPSAQVWHHYAFHRNPSKLYFVERNRLVVVLTVFHRRTLLALLPALLLAEVALLGAALTQRRLRDKLRGYAWLVRHAGYLRERRRRVQHARKASDAGFLALAADRVESPLAVGPATAAGNLVLPAYWRIAGRLL